MGKVVIKILQGSAVTLTTLGGLTIHRPVANFLEYMCAKNYGYWLAVDTVLQKLSGLLFLAHPVHVVELSAILRFSGVLCIARSVTQPRYAQLTRCFSAVARPFVFVSIFLLQCSVRYTVRVSVFPWDEEVNHANTWSRPLAAHAACALSKPPASTPGLSAVRVLL